MEEQAEYYPKGVQKDHTSETPSDDARIEVAWPEFNDVMQALGMTVVYPEGREAIVMGEKVNVPSGDIAEALMLEAKVELTEDAAISLLYTLDYMYEHRRIDARDYEHYRRLMMGWVNG